jgi:hypothetical protein
MATPPQTAQTAQQQSQQQPNPQQQPKPAPSIIDYTQLQWELDEPPPTTHTICGHPLLFHLYLTSGLLLIAPWPAHGDVAINAHHHHTHIVGWAPVTIPTTVLH